MKHLSEYRNSDHARTLSIEIARVRIDRPIQIMEVCGTHTMSIARFGLKQLLPKNIRLISGPGCPVCVTPNNFLDRAIAISKIADTTICTFGDMMRVPGSSSSLEVEHARGSDIRVVYSTLDALMIARAHPDRNVVFLGVGFETTAPTIASSIEIAHSEGLKNYSVLCAHKVVPPAIEALLSGEVKIDGFLLPGHVSSIIGAKSYRGIAERHAIACSIAGFEPSDILGALLEITTQISNSKPAIHTAYARAVTEIGNSKALAVLDRVFESCDANWRGIGNIPGSGLAIRDKFSQHDAAKRFPVSIDESVDNPACRCGDILTGKISPDECPLFRNGCTPDHPIGACMVSNEGSCAAHFNYGATNI